MQNSAILKEKGMRVLAEQLGLVEAERFIVMLRREQFDYTQWRHGLFNDVPLDEFLRDAQEYRDKCLTNEEQLVAAVKRKNIPNIKLPADENGYAFIDKEKYPELYEWAVEEE